MATVDATTSSTDETGPQNPHRPFRNPLTHPHGPNAIRIPLPPQPHPREQPNGINGFDSGNAWNFQALQTHPQFSVHPPFREVKNWDAWKIIIIFTAVAPLIY